MSEICPFCGAGLFWSAGQTTEFKCNTRITETGFSPHLGKECLQAQITALEALVREMGEKCKQYHFGNPIREILNRPIAKKIMEEKK